MKKNTINTYLDLSINRIKFFVAYIAISIFVGGFLIGLFVAAFFKLMIILSILMFDIKLDNLNISDILKAILKFIVLLLITGIAFGTLIKLGVVIWGIL